MSSKPTHVGSEVMPRAYTNTEASHHEKQALILFSRFETSGVLFAAEFRKLQDGGVHLLRGYKNFGTYAERTFEGLSQVNAQNISRQGAIMLLLEKYGRIELKPSENLPQVYVRLLAYSKTLARM